MSGMRQDIQRPIRSQPPHAGHPWSLPSQRRKHAPTKIVVLDDDVASANYPAAAPSSRSHERASRFVDSGRKNFTDAEFGLETAVAEKEQDRLLGLQRQRRRAAARRTDNSTAASVDRQRGRAEARQPTDVAAAAA